MTQATKPLYTVEEYFAQEEEAEHKSECYYVAPDLVVEVNSPSDTDERRFEKLQAYQQSGVKLIWSIHMLEKIVVVYQKGEDYPTFYTLKDEIDGGEVLPNFKLPVKSLFE